MWVEGKAMLLEQTVGHPCPEEDKGRPKEGAVQEEQQSIEEGDSPPELEPLPEQRLAAYPGEGPARITRREREVALLIGRGMTNRQIAQALGLSEHTVANHVAKILKKLGFRCRAQVAGWLARRR